MKIILISGKAEAGKTTAAKFLKEELESRGERVAITPYGRLVKDLCNMLYGWDGKKDEAGRQLLQHFGTDVVRVQDKHYWSRHVRDLAWILRDEFDTFIIDDCRFPDEVVCWEIEEAHDVYWLRIERPGYENHLTPEQRLHPSETALDGYELTMCSTIRDACITNTGSLRDFGSSVVDTFNKIEFLSKAFHHE